MSDMQDRPYRWRLAAQAALRWAKKGQANIEARAAVIADDPERRDEYLLAKEVWGELRHLEVHLEPLLNPKRD